MVKLTNNFNLPDPIVEAILADDYDKGDADYSVTELWSPPRIKELERQHAAELTTDAIDNIWSLFGRAVHDMLAKQDMQAITEKRLYITRNGKKIGGKFDRFVVHLGGIEDYKVTSVWHVMNLTPGSEWETQLNSYAHILQENKLGVNYLRVNALLRDWNKHEAKRIENYPQKQLITVDLPLWDAAKAEAALMERLAMHEAARSTLPDCTPGDRWYRPGTYAVMKDGNKKATKRFNSEPDAAAFMAVHKDSSKMFIERRPGSYLRCEGYCPVSEFCSQWGADPDNPANILKGLEDV